MMYQKFRKICHIQIWKHLILIHRLYFQYYLIFKQYLKSYNLKHVNLRDLIILLKLLIWPSIFFVYPYGMDHQNYRYKILEINWSEESESVVDSKIWLINFVARYSNELIFVNQKYNIWSDDTLNFFWNFNGTRSFIKCILKTL